METSVKIQLRMKFNRVLLTTSVIFASLFIFVVVVEWVKSTYTPFYGFGNYKWITGLRNLIYLMSMFNILLIRYVIMRIYTAPGHIDFKTIVNRLSKSDIASMLISELPCFFGFVLFLLAGDMIDFYLLFGLSVIYSIIYYPRYKKWVSLVEENSMKN